MGALASLLNIKMEFAILVSTLEKYSFMMFAKFFGYCTIFPSSVTSLERVATFLVFVLANS